MPDRISSVGILLNPHSGRIKQDVSLIRKLAGDITGGVYREACNQREIETVLNEFAGRQLGVLVIVGGDGTVHAVLSHLFAGKVFAHPPLISIIPAGTTNMTAKDFYISGKPEQVFTRLLKLMAGPGPYPLITRPVLRIKNGDDRAQYGMFFGAGIIAEGVKYFQKRVRGLGITGERASGIVLLRFLFSLLLGRGGDSGKITAHVQFNDETGRDEQSLLILATSLDRLLLGLRPYWGRQALPVHATLVRASPQRLWRSILPLLCGRGAGLSEQNGYSSCNLSTLSIMMTGDFIIDGELYRADREKGAVHISANETISVIGLNT